ncbi:MAG TPA: monovalent cation/H(+) antiporter subunit G [Cerasibacillus sp.]|uniref:monovalent cation/H(+) antiporter subunit G n=1 Tax=Cerasibacillus sp. TaxID=2498711 RepID=UPI002F40B714
MIETWINIILNIVIILFLLTGTFFVVSSSIGIVRFPDIYTRLHAATKASTLGLAGILLGMFIFLYIQHNIISGKLLLALFFILLTNPVSGHMISRAAHRAGVKPLTKNRKDELANAMKQNKA